jgi:hypothetical protein
MLGKLLTGAEAKENDFESLILINRTAERAVGWRLDLARNIGKERIGVDHN